MIDSGSLHIQPESNLIQRKNLSEKIKIIQLFYQMSRKTNRKKSESLQNNWVINTIKSSFTLLIKINDAKRSMIVICPLTKNQQTNQKTIMDKTDENSYQTKSIVSLLIASFLRACTVMNHTIYRSFCRRIINSKYTMSPMI